MSIGFRPQVSLEVSAEAAHEDIMALGRGGAPTDNLTRQKLLRQMLSKEASDWAEHMHKKPAPSSVGALLNAKDKKVCDGC